MTDRLDELGASIDAKFRRIEEPLSKLATSNNRMVDTLREHGERLEGLEAGADRPRAGGSGNRYSAADCEHKSIFLEWLRQPTNASRQARLSEAQDELSKKGVTIGTPGSGGGYALPKEISADIETRVRQLNPFRGLVDVVQVSSNDFHSLVSMGDGTSGWSTETGTRSATAAPTLRDVQPSFGELYAVVTASNWSLQDLFFNVQDWLVNDVSAEFSAVEATAIISGNGSAQPTGILNATPTLSADSASPMRAANVIQYVPLTSPGSPLRLTLDSLIDLVGTLRERYIQEADRCAFVMHRLTLAALRRQKASTAGLYLLEPDAQAGIPTQILGYRVVTCDAMPTNVAGNYPVLFGNFRRGYILADRVGMSVIVDPYTTKGSTVLYISRRVGGCIRNNDALKAVKNA